MGRLLALTLAYLAYLLATAIGSERQQRQQHRVQHGPCSYTFILPEVEHCDPLQDFQVTNTLQGDSPPEAEADTSQSKQSKAQRERPSWQERKLENLESAMENNTQWLQKVRSPNRYLNQPLLSVTLPSSHPSYIEQLSLQTFKLKKSQDVHGVHCLILSVDKPSSLIGSALSCDFLDDFCIHIWLHDNAWCTSLYLRPLGCKNSPLHASRGRQDEINLGSCQICLTRLNLLNEYFTPWATSFAETSLLTHVFVHL